MDTAYAQAPQRAPLTDPATIAAAPICDWYEATVVHTDGGAGIVVDEGRFELELAIGCVRVTNNTPITKVIPIAQVIEMMPLSVIDPDGEPF